MKHLRCLGLAAVLGLPILLAGCYTRLGYGDPSGGLYGSGDLRYDQVDYWSEYYYVLIPYSPWEPFPGRNWWYHDHYCFWDVVDPYPDYEDYDAVSARRGWSSSPGASPSRGPSPRMSPSVGSPAPSTPGEQEAPPKVDSRNPGRNREGSATPPETPDPASEPKKEERKAWGR